MPNKVYGLPEAATTFKDSGGDVTLTLANLDHGVGRISAQNDRGAGAKPMRYRVHATFTMSTDHATVLGELIELYAASSDGTTVDGNVGTSDAALTVEKRRNLIPLGAVQADIASNAANVFTATFTAYLFDRYISIGVWNGTSNKIASGSVTLTPCSDEIEAAT